MAMANGGVLLPTISVTTTMKVAPKPGEPFSQELERSVKVFWLPPEVSQSHKQESKACTLIALQFLENCHEANLEFTIDSPSQDLIHIFKKSIEQGNEIYSKLYNAGMLQERYLNVPEALTAITYRTRERLVEWRSFFYDTPIAQTLYTNLKENLKQWQSSKPLDASSDISVVLIANLRAVALVITKTSKVVTLVDSHAHCPYGAVIAIVPHNCLESLCRWYASQLEEDTQPNPVTCYELSFIYHRGSPLMGFLKK